MKRTRFINSFVFISILTVLFLFQAFRQYSPPNISLASYYYTTQTFFFTPQRTVPTYDYVFTEPHVSTSPTSKKYFLTQLNETLDRTFHTYTPLFFASKRISEIFAWHTDLRIYGSYPTYDDLIKNYSALAPDSWEHILGRYLVDIENHFRIIPDSGFTRMEKLSELKMYVLSHRDKVDMRIAEGKNKRSEQDSKYLQSLADSIFDSLLEKIDPISSNRYPHEIRYDLKSITERKEQGLFNASFNLSFVPASMRAQLALQTSSGQIQRVSEVTQADGTTLFTYPNVRVNEPVRNIFTLSGFTPSPYLGSWQKISSTDEFQRYHFSISHFEPNQTYLLQMKYRLSRDVNLNVFELSSSRHDLLNTVLRKTNFHPRDYTNYLVFMKSSSDSTAGIELVNKVGIPESELSGITVQVLPVYEPYLQLDRVAALPGRTPSVSISKGDDSSYNVSVRNTYLSQDEQIRQQLGTNWKVTEQTHHDPSNYTLTIVPVFQLRYFTLIIIIWILFFVYLFRIFLYKFFYLLRTRALKFIFNTAYARKFTIIVSWMYSVIYAVSFIFLAVFIFFMGAQLISWNAINTTLLIGITISSICMVAFNAVRLQILYFLTLILLSICLILQIFNLNLLVLLFSSVGLTCFISCVVCSLGVLQITDSKNSDRK